MLSLTHHLRVTAIDPQSTKLQVPDKKSYPIYIFWIKACMINDQHQGCSDTYKLELIHRHTNILYLKKLLYIPIYLVRNLEWDIVVHVKRSLQVKLSYAYLSDQRSNIQVLNKRLPGKLQYLNKTCRRKQWQDTVTLMLNYSNRGSPKIITRCNHYGRGAIQFSNHVKPANKMVK
jgi:hypothetical protein